MTATLGTNTPPSGVVYLVHFTEPYRHARHTPAGPPTSTAGSPSTRPDAAPAFYR